MGGGASLLSRNQISSQDIGAETGRVKKQQELPVPSSRLDKQHNAAQAERKGELLGDARVTAAERADLELSFENVRKRLGGGDRVGVKHLAISRELAGNPFAFRLLQSHADDGEELSMQEFVDAVQQLKSAHSAAAKSQRATRALPSAYSITNSAAARSASFLRAHFERIRTTTDRC
eukprot:CAMPEP_0114320756 /NCGR_PEP_ID=MMETSP0059-20121206/26142_1 /TAXON_ID=36894 /ORGANISM="Pyramimonas parkeae, Strain CCMP726" /LENGTH=176 /DNA_ID=CAMNT_0001448247 /DNA_START=198 /DNA_END=728 /DNA_ORIENTATION=+